MGDDVTPPVSTGGLVVLGLQVAAVVVAPGRTRGPLLAPASAVPLAVPAGPGWSAAGATGMALLPVFGAIQDG